jgi:hypothetical protein
MNSRELSFNQLISEPVLLTIRASAGEILDLGADLDLSRGSPGRFVLAPATPDLSPYRSSTGSPQLYWQAVSP